MYVTEGGCCTVHKHLLYCLYSYFYNSIQLHPNLTSIELNSDPGFSLPLAELYTQDYGGWANIHQGDQPHQNMISRKLAHCTNSGDGLDINFWNFGTNGNSLSKNVMAMRVVV